MKTRTSKRRARESAEEGFALVLVVVLLGLLVVLLVGLATVARLEARVGENTRDLAIARRHARLGLQRALGELQRVAGPDTCATARATLLFSCDPNRTHWTGAWQAGESTPRWLVSCVPGTLPDPTSVVWQDPVTLVSGGSVEILGADEANPNVVRVETVPLTVPAALRPGWTLPDDPEIGRYAFWVGDEGVKASVYVPDERYALAGVPGSERWPQTDPGVFWGGTDLGTPARQAALAKVQAYSQLGYCDPAFTPLRMRQNFHSVTVTALGVPANSAVGGLKVSAVTDGGDPYRPGGVPAYDAVYLREAPAIDATSPRALPAPRFGLRRSRGVVPPASALTGVDASRHLLVAGVFNLNGVAMQSEAQRLVWRTLLAAARDLVWEDGTTRTLTDGEREALATELTAARFRAAYPVAGKALHEPFRSLESFATSDLLADALAATSINDGRTPLSPDFVTADHLLARIAPLLAVRSDTFVIRAYGDARNPSTGEVVGRAWCEALVQRVADYVDPGDNPLSPPGRPDNLAFGRHFIVTSFRWLSAADL